VVCAEVGGTAAQAISNSGKELWCGLRYFCLLTFRDDPIFRPVIFAASLPSPGWTSVVDCFYFRRVADCLRAVILSATAYAYGQLTKSFGLLKIPFSVS
jgi:hypothetical protein